MNIRQDYKDLQLAQLIFIQRPIKLLGDHQTAGLLELAPGPAKSVSADSRPDCRLVLTDLKGDCPPRLRGPASGPA